MSNPNSIQEQREIRRQRILASKGNRLEQIISTTSASTAVKDLNLSSPPLHSSPSASLISPSQKVSADVSSVNSSPSSHSPLSFDINHSNSISAFAPLDPSGDNHNDTSNSVSNPKIEKNQNSSDNLKSNLNSTVQKSEIESAKTCLNFQRKVGTESEELENLNLKLWKFNFNLNFSFTDFIVSVYSTAMLSFIYSLYLIFSLYSINGDFSVTFEAISISLNNPSISNPSLDYDPSAVALKSVFPVSDNFGLLWLMSLWFCKIAVFLMFKLSNVNNVLYRIWRVGGIIFVDCVVFVFVSVCSLLAFSSLTF